MGFVVVVASVRGVDATVTDSSGQNLTLGNVTFPDGNNRQQPFLQLKLTKPGKDSDRNEVELHLAASSLKEITIDPASKGKRDYRTRVVVTLVDGTQYRGEVGGQMHGENELGKGSIEFNKLERAAFTRVAGDSDYAPDKTGVAGQIVDENGNNFAVSSVGTGRDNNRATELECDLGEIKLAVPVESIAKIEKTGEVKREYATGPKLRLTMATGRTLDVTADSGRQLAAHFKHGRVEIPLSALATATFEKKK